MVVKASITGHKVYSTIHCKSAKEVYLRLENMGIKSYLIKDALIGIISQRLIKILCSKCKKVDYKNSLKDKVLYEKCGCKACNYSGYGGRKIVGAVHYLKEGIGDINKYEKYLSNEEMKENLKKLLSEGYISKNDYIEFIEGERLIE